jgi:hypothetical protein
MTTHDCLLLLLVWLCVLQHADGDWRAYNCTRLQRAASTAAKQLLAERKAAAEQQQQQQEQGKKGREADPELQWEMVKRVSCWWD